MKVFIPLLLLALAAVVSRGQVVEDAMLVDSVEPNVELLKELPFFVEGEDSSASSGGDSLIVEVGSDRPTDSDDSEDASEESFSVLDLLWNALLPTDNAVPNTNGMHCQESGTSMFCWSIVGDDEAAQAADSTMNWKAGEDTVVEGVVVHNFAVDGEPGPSALGAPAGVVSSEGDDILAAGGLFGPLLIQPLDIGADGHDHMHGHGHHKHHMHKHHGSHGHSHDDDDDDDDDDVLSATALFDFIDNVLFGVPTTNRAEDLKASIDRSKVPLVEGVDPIDTCMSFPLSQDQVDCLQQLIWDMRDNEELYMNSVDALLLSVAISLLLSVPVLILFYVIRRCCCHSSDNAEDVVEIPASILLKSSNVVPQEQQPLVVVHETSMADDSPRSLGEDGEVEVVSRRAFVPVVVTTTNLDHDFKPVSFIPDSDE